MSYRPVTDGLSYRRPLTGRLRHLSQQQQGESVFPFLLKPLSQSNEFGWEKRRQFQNRNAVSYFHECTTDDSPQHTQSGNYRVGGGRDDVKLYIYMWTRWTSIIFFCCLIPIHSLSPVFWYMIEIKNHLPCSLSI